MLSRQAEREIDELERQREGATPSEQKEIDREIREIEREASEYEREMERREEWDRGHRGGW